jgi:hypothetical protein
MTLNADKWKSSTSCLCKRHPLTLTYSSPQYHKSQIEIPPEPPGSFIADLIFLCYFLFIKEKKVTDYGQGAQTLSCKQ